MQQKFFTLLVLFGLTLTAFSQDLDNPGNYISAISKAHVDMNQRYMAYVSAAAHSRRAKKIEKLRTAALESIETAKMNTIDLPIYKGDNVLRQASIDYIQMCYNVFNDDYSKIVNMEEIAEQSYDGMQAYILLQEKTGEKLREAGDKMQNASKAFAQKYNVNLIDSKSELGEKMEKSSKTNHYFNQIYLLYFKCSWQDGVLTKALNAKKLNDAEQARNALIKFAEEGLKILDTFPRFDGDASMINTCKQALKDYKKMAETDVLKMTDYYLKDENFQKIKKSLDAKSESSRTQQDIDAFNKAVNEINAAVNASNEASNKTNQIRNQIQQNWELTSKTFFDEHVPQYKK
jgi:hypothetical protein